MKISNLSEIKLKNEKSMKLKQSSCKHGSFLTCAKIVVSLFLLFNIIVIILQHFQIDEQFENKFIQKYGQILNTHFLLPLRNLLSRLSNKMSKTSGLTILGNISLRLPERIQLDDTQTMNLTESESNLPAMYFNRWKQRDFGENAFKYKNVNYCPNVKMISPHRIRQNNLFWQIVQTDEPEMIVYAYNAYYDNRIYGKPTVKIMTVTDRQVPVQKRKWW